MLFKGSLIRNDRFSHYGSVLRGPWFASSDNSFGAARDTSRLFPRRLLACLIVSNGISTPGLALFCFEPDVLCMCLTSKPTLILCGLACVVGLFSQEACPLEDSKTVQLYILFDLFHFPLDLLFKYRCDSEILLSP